MSDEIEFTIAHQPNNTITFILHKSISTTDHEVLAEYIKSYKNLSDRLEDLKPVSEKKYATIIIKQADGSFLDEDQNPISAPNDTLAPQYTFTVTQKDKQITLGLHIPPIGDNKDNNKTEHYKKQLALNKIFLYAKELQFNLKLIEPPILEITGAEQAQKDYEKAKESILNRNTALAVASMGLFALSFAISITAIGIAFTGILAYGLAFTAFVIACTTVSWSAFIVAGFLAPAIPLYFTEKKDKEHKLCELYNNHLSKQLHSHPSAELSTQPSITIVTKTQQPEILVPSSMVNQTNQTTEIAPPLVEDASPAPGPDVAAPAAGKSLKAAK